MKKVRQKKFIGAIIGAVGQVAGAIGKAVKAKKEAQAEQEKYEKEQGQANLQAAIQNKQSLEQELQNQDYANTMKSRVELKCGGSYKNRTKIKSKTKNKKYKKELGTQEFKCGGTKTKLKCGGTKKCEYGNRTKYSCGGRKKAGLGDIIGGASSAVSGVSDLISGLTYKPKDYTILNPETIQANAQKIIQPTNNVNNQQTINPLYNNVPQMQAKCGKKIKIKSNKHK